ncbi:MAG: UDPGP type 1 family protein [Planctomycetaceae bacterium]|nr:UDPGP type 1 family protein [Planctomycetaceae bacterium]
MLAGRAGDPPAYKFSTVTDLTPCKPRIPVSSQEALSAGQDVLRQGKVGVILVAGGQGTRLGFPHPKGMYSIGAVSGATLFQIHFEKVIAVARRYGYQVPFAIMTSPATHQETIDFLEQKNYFGLRREDVFIFCQGTMPAVSLDSGKVLLESKGGIALSPDGHGGMLAAITKSGVGGISVLDNFRRRGIEYLFYYQVDNPLVQVCSPEFLGYHFLSGSELTSQVIRKRFPMMKVGNIVEVDGRLYVIEYSDLTEDVASQVKPDGSLKIWAGNIAAHIFNVSLLERTAKIATSLPFHVARKKVPFIDIATGNLIKPDKENAIKFERFIFDLLPLAKNAVVVEVDQENHYAPVKNAPGSQANSPETVKQNITNMHAEWLRKAGAVVDKNVQIEISPLFADSPEELKQKIKEGAVFNKTTYLKNT